MRKIQTLKNNQLKKSNQKKSLNYQIPKLVVHSGSDFVRKLGPAQACSGTPDFY